jgi:Head binding
MSSLVTNSTPQFINPIFGNPCDRAIIYIGYVNTDGLQPELKQPVYMMQWIDEATLNKVLSPQPLITNDAGVIVYNGIPVTP